MSRGRPMTSHFYYNQNDLPLVLAFDEQLRNQAVLMDGGEREFSRFVSRISSLYVKRWREAEVSKERLVELIKEKKKELLVKNYKIKQARKMIEEERKTRKKVEVEKEALVKQLCMLKNIIRSGSERGLGSEALERIHNIGISEQPNPYSIAVQQLLNETDGTSESVLNVSDLSFDDTQEDQIVLGNKRCFFSNVERYSNKRLGLTGADELPASAVRVPAPVDKEGNAHTESINEAVLGTMDELKKKARKSRERKVTYGEYDHELRFSYCPPADALSHCSDEVNTLDPPSYCTQVKRHLSKASLPITDNRSHGWSRRKMVVGDRCRPCGTKIGFSKECLQCKSCFVTCHIECRRKIPIPCGIASTCLPSNLRVAKHLADFVPKDSPLIPALLRHCLREIEKRGLREIGIYRVPGSETEATELLEKFLRGKGDPLLSKYEIHVVASTVKKFLHSLKEPIITASFRKDFVDAASKRNTNQGIGQIVSKLPKPNRDTLAFVVLHLQKVAESPHCKMGAENLCKIWGPAVLGNSSSELKAMTFELPEQKCVMKALLSTHSSLWEKLLQPNQEIILPRYCTPERERERVSFLPSAMKTGAVAKRTRSRQIAIQRSFQSPML